METLRGQLLLAAPSLLDPNFHRTVVLVGEHNDEGAMGVVLNRPSGVTVGQAVPALADAIDGSSTVFVGGPVQPSAVVFVGEFLDPEHAAVLAFGRIGFPSQETDIGELSDVTERRRVFAGYTGWGPGQLEGEVQNEDWILAPARPGDVFTDEPQALWSAVMGRKGGRFTLLASMPLDPSLN